MKPLILLFSFVILLQAKTQTVKVKGIVTCGIDPLPGIAIELWEADTFDPDDIMASQGISNHDGKFKLQGAIEEVTPIEPYIYFRHRCRVRPGCWRFTKIKIQAEQMNTREWVDLSFVNMGVRSEDGDKEVCS